MSFEELYKAGTFKFKGDFRIRRIRELVEVEYGQDYFHKTEIGRVQVLDHENEEQLAFDGQMTLDENCKYCLDGYGRYVSQKIFNNGFYKNHLLNGKAKFVHIDGKVQEGEFATNLLNGKGGFKHPDGTVEEGLFLNNKLNGQGVRILPDRTT